MNFKGDTIQPQTEPNFYFMKEGNMPQSHLGRGFPLLGAPPAPRQHVSKHPPSAFLISLDLV